MYKVNIRRNSFSVCPRQREPNALVGFLPSPLFEKGDSYYITIMAVDAASFAELVDRNPDVIIAQVEKGFQRNKGIRRRIKES